MAARQTKGCSRTDAVEQPHLVRHVHKWYPTMSTLLLAREGFVPESQEAPAAARDGGWCYGENTPLAPGDRARFSYAVVEIKAQERGRPLWIRKLVESGLDPFRQQAARSRHLQEGHTAESLSRGDARPRVLLMTGPHLNECP